jgi:hypothetical protein
MVCGEFSNAGLSGSRAGQGKYFPEAAAEGSYLDLDSSLKRAAPAVITDY